MATTNLLKSNIGARCSGALVAALSLGGMAPLADAAYVSGGAGIAHLNAADGVSVQVRQASKTMSDGKSVTFWHWCAGGMGGGGMGGGGMGGGGGGGGCQLAGPTLELGVGQQANVTLDMMMAPQENPPYHGHTIHPHGLDVRQSEDGVPETGAAVLGDNYSFTVDSRYVGSHAYHCHVHTVKHLEMGMVAAFIVKDTDSRGNFVDVINHGGPAYDYEWNMVLSTVDPAYHTATGDSTVFADYNPKYFLLNGLEGKTKSAPAENVTAAAGKKLAIRLIGMHSVNSTFEIKNASGSGQSFTVYNKDGFKLPAPITTDKLDLSPGQTADLMVTLPSTTGSWYPQVTYKNLRNGASYATVYSRVNF
jgi:FtsP/CotA-like multicopper oxidase with cupredoxin domain